MTTPATDERVDVGGLTLAVRRWEAAGTPFVLVHGLASTARTWEAVARELVASGSAVATVDLRGHGRSDTPASGYDTASVVADLIGVVEALGWDRPVLVGQSWGGNLALAYAWTAPDTVRGVAGVDGGTIELQARWPVWEDCARDLAPPSVAGKTIDDLAAEQREEHPDWSDEAVAAALASYVVRDDGTVAPILDRDHHLAALRGLWEQRPSSLYPQIAVPVLLLPAGDRDASWTDDKRAEVDAAAAALARARVRWFPDSDHDVHLQRPAEVAQALRAAVDDGFFA
ncbi:MAG: alpha/beta hydrolase [Actinomycetota bacterium]|nr:alpha/beta hydrolase [Actinomycetota bacterium]